MKKKLLAFLCVMTMTASALPVPAPAAEVGPVPPPSEETAQPVEAPAVQQVGTPVFPAPVPVSPVLVGLAYGTGTRPGANLANGVGSGFRFGFLDGDRVFQLTGYTVETSISVVKTQNVWFGVDPKISDTLKNYSDQIKTDVFVGCWHVRLPGEFLDYDTAAQYASSMGGFPAWIKGEYQVRFGAYETREEAQAAAELIGGTVVGTSAYGVSVVRTGASTVLFQFDSGEEATGLAVMPDLYGSEKPTTWFNKVRWYGGFVYKRLGGGNLTVINAVEMEDYISCLLSQEMSPSWPMEALKAQAVCARNYVEAENRGHKGFDVCNTVDCQAYPGITGENERTRQAAQETAGIRAWYDGKLALTYYYASNGGGSENIRNVWPGNQQIPYLCGVADPYEETVKEKIAYWDATKTITAQSLRETLNAKGYNASNIVEVKTEPTPTGNVKTLILVDDNGKSWPFVRESGVRNMLGLRSIRYWVEKVDTGTKNGVLYTDGGGTISSLEGLWVLDGDGTAKQVEGEVYAVTSAGVSQLTIPQVATDGQVSFVFHTSGWGHSVGMSQWGAYAMAQQGLSYQDILTFYYPGIQLY